MTNQCEGCDGDAATEGAYRSVSLRVEKVNLKNKTIVKPVKAVTLVHLQHHMMEHTHSTYMFYAVKTQAPYLFI